MYHEPVLLNESVDGLAIKPNGVYVDCTFGGGGHSKEILSRLNEEGRLYAFDQDADAANNAIDDLRFSLLPMNFRFIERGLRIHNLRKVDGILADLGVSSHQFDTAARGFSLRFDGPLDMRMNTASKLSAAELLMQVDEPELIHILRTYGEIPNAKRLATALIERRGSQPIKSTFELVDLLNGFSPVQKKHSYQAQVFQALRIAVNEELEALRALLESSLSLLDEGGRLSIISYHSLEDRMVKRFVKEGWMDDEAQRDAFGRRHFRFQPVHKKTIDPSEEEIASNPRARSARLRVAERVELWK